MTTFSPKKQGHTQIHAYIHVRICIYTYNVHVHVHVRTPGEDRTFSGRSTSSPGWYLHTGHWRLAAEPWAHPPVECRPQRCPPIRVGCKTHSMSHLHVHVHAVYI